MRTGIAKLLVKSILQKPLGHDWSVQGFGMLRMYLDKEVRLHVWNSFGRVEGVSDIHDHPWNFRSYIIAGELENRTYHVSKPGGVCGIPSQAYDEYAIKAGENAYLVGDPKPVNMRWWADKYREGDYYSQDWRDVHSSHPADGTVTVIDRNLVGEPDYARVFVPKGSEWVSAAPRKATDDEVLRFCDESLKRWFT